MGDEIGPLLFVANGDCGLRSCWAIFFYLFVIAGAAI